MYVGIKKQDTSKQNSPGLILSASIIGTTIEYFDFFMFGTAAALIFPRLFFPSHNEQLAILQSLLVFGAAFFSRPLGSIIFGHFGDKIGRKKTLIAALLTMGVSTLIVGLLPTYETIGWWAPLFLTMCRIGQGLGLGGEWGGAVLLATENAPPEKRGWYAMFPQLGMPTGLFLSITVFFVLWHFFDNKEVDEWAWRIPFIASALFMMIGVWIRTLINETAEFKKSLDRQERARIPIADVFLKYPRVFLLGTFAGMTTFALFYLVSTYLLSYITNHLQFSFNQALETQMVGAIFCCLFTVLTGKIADRIKRRTLMIFATVIIGIYSFSIPYFLNSGIAGIFAMSIIGLSFMGITFSPLGAVLASPFPTTIRYTGSSVVFNSASIVGASFSPYIAEYLVQNFGTAYVGYYLFLCSFISLLCFIGFTDEEISN